MKDHPWGRCLVEDPDLTTLDEPSMSDESYVTIVVFELERR